MKFKKHTFEGIKLELEDYIKASTLKNKSWQRFFRNVGYSKDQIQNFKVALAGLNGITERYKKGKLSLEQMTEEAYNILDSVFRKSELILPDGQYGTIIIEQAKDAIEDARRMLGSVSVLPGTLISAAFPKGHQILYYAKERLKEMIDCNLHQKSEFYEEVLPFEDKDVDIVEMNSLTF